MPPKEEFALKQVLNYLSEPFSNRLKLKDMNVKIYNLPIWPKCDTQCQLWVKSCFQTFSICSRNNQNSQLSAIGSKFEIECTQTLSSHFI